MMIKPTEVLGQPAMWLRAPDGAQATVLLHGAHLVSWIPAGDQERLYLSPLAVAGPGQAVRGGVPVVFPQFAGTGPLPQHGLLRTREWAWDQGEVRAGAAVGVLRLADDASTRALWPHPFEAELTVVICGLGLDIELAITNTGDTPFEFTAALHTYLLCDDVQRAKLAGLYGVRYLDKLTGATQAQEFDPFGFAGEVDRIYFDAVKPVSLATGMGRMTIQAEGFPDLVVWNPGPARAAALSDLPDADWQHMLCLEAAAIGSPVRLAAGETWAARQSLAA